MRNVGKSLSCGFCRKPRAEFGGSAPSSALRLPACASCLPGAVRVPGQALGAPGGSAGRWVCCAPAGLWVLSLLPTEDWCQLSWDFVCSSGSCPGALAYAEHEGAGSLGYLVPVGMGGTPPCCPRLPSWGRCGWCLGSPEGGGGLCRSVP